MTKKELLEGGWIDQYVLGLTSEEESLEVERLANLYPEIQAEINTAREKLCSNFNRNLTRPVLQSRYLSRRNIILGSIALISIPLLAFLFICREHFSLQKDYKSTCDKLAKEKERGDKLAHVSERFTAQSKFISGSNTERVKIRGCGKTPEAELILYKCKRSGKMMLQVVDLPKLTDDRYFEVWATEPKLPSKLVGVINAPLKFDSIYTLTPSLTSTGLEVFIANATSGRLSQVCLNVPN